MLGFVVVICASVWVYREQKRQLHDREVARLTAIAQMKARALGSWRHERLGDGVVLGGSPLFADAAARWLAEGGARDRAHLLAVLSAFSKYFGYADVGLLDGAGSIRLNVTGTLGTLDTEARAGFIRALATGAAEFVDLHASSAGQSVHSEVVVPISEEAVFGRRTIGAVILRSDAATSLFPALAEWPSSDTSGELLLARREGDAARVLGPLRFSEAAPLTLRWRQERSDDPTLRALGGVRGAVEGRDYRGVGVLAVISEVPDSPWLLIAKIDEREALAAWRSRAVTILATSLAVLSAVVAAVAFLHQRGAKRHFRALYAAENARRAADERQRTILMTVGDGVIATDSDGAIETLNPAAEAMTGWRSEEARGRPIEEVFRTEPPEAREPSDDPERATTLGRRRSAPSNQTSLIARDGSIRPISDKNSPIRDEAGRLSGAVIVLRDQTWERASERALVAERENLEALMSSSPVALLLLDEDSRVLQANPATTRLLGAPGDAVRGLRLGDILRCPNCELDVRGCGASIACKGCKARALLFAASHATASPRECEFEIPASAGSADGARSVRLSAQLLHGDGPPRTVLALWDVTEQKRAAETRKNLERQLADAMRLESVGRLAGGVAHDFNNLMTVVLTNVEMVLEDLGDAHACTRDLLDVRMAAERAATLTRQLLAFGRKQLLRPRLLSVDAVLQGVEPLLRSAVGKTIELRLELGGCARRVSADPVEVERVVMNLAVNARDAMPHGGRLTIQTEDTMLDAAAGARHQLLPGAYVSIAVIDTGLGMNAATCARIFDPFFTTKELGKGTGLGLATVHGIVAQSGGAISVQSQPGEGTTFRIWLPAATGSSDSEAPPTSRVQAHEAREAHEARARALVVEDQPELRNAAERLLRVAGFEVSTAASGENALSLLERDPEPFHAMLTDVMMPGMSGIELAERVVARWPGVALVFMSGYAYEAFEERSGAFPGARFLAKPFKPGELIDAMRDALSEGKGRPSVHASPAGAPPKDARAAP